MTDVKVEQCDINEAEEFRDILDSADAVYPSYAIAALAEILARHRQAAEKAQQERAAAIADRASERARINVQQLSGPNSDPNDECSNYLWSQQTASFIAAAIRSQGHE